MPGLALGYKIGQLKIQELGAKYDQLLAGGAIPLAILERTMDARAARRR